MKTIFAIVIGMISCCSLFSRDTLDLPQQRIGVSFMYESVYENLLNNKTGNAFEFGTYYEKKILKRSSLSFALNFRYKNFTENLNQVDNTDGLDTLIAIDLFEVDRQLLKISTPISFKFYYLNTPKVYFLVGIGPEFTLKGKNKANYLKTIYRTDMQQYLGEAVLNNATLNNVEHSFFNVKVDFGIGIALKRTSLELVLRNDIGNESTANIGIRIKQQIGGFSKKEK